MYNNIKFLESATLIWHDQSREWGRVKAQNGNATGKTIAENDQNNQRSFRVELIKLNISENDEIL